MRKLGSPQKARRNSQIRLETQIKKLRKQARIMKKVGAEISWNKKEQTTQEKITVQLKEINQKVLAKVGRLEIYRQRVKQCRHNKIFQTTTEKSIFNSEGVTRKLTNNQLPKKPNDFGRKYGNQKNIPKMLIG